ncbi:isochorismatase family protein [Bacillus sp. AFS031507]|uniref:isochorismatase family protein n=1 Tax=Bacillus sp. AFS031507 TaxID=2033496 RepID=UPI000BFCE78C|nr:isochorismatase family protein [Bacillus sp. AFS031507]PGY07305.1 hypothetical protein COE25_24610 [Bacillus sp. AFS031507]
MKNNIEEKFVEQSKIYMKRSFSLKQALLVIDAQQELIDGSEKENPVLNKDALLININLVIEKALALGIEIIFIRDSDVAEGKGIGFESSSNLSEPINSISMYLLHPHIN